LQILKQDYAIIAKESHEWVDSFPVIRGMSQKVEQLGTKIWRFQLQCILCDSIAI
jgi:hypothetical protein